MRIAHASDGLAAPARIFILSLILPWIITIGPLALTVPRIVLLVLLVPCLAMWVMGKAGSIRVTDVALLLFCAWSAFSLIMVEGASAAIEPAGVLAIETLGPYMIARIYIRSSSDFRNMAVQLFAIIVILCPFAVIEAVTGRDVLLEFFASILPTYPDAGDSTRAGLTRVQSVFEHPILFGACVGVTLSLVHLVLGYQQSVIRRWWKTIIVAVTALLSLSSAPISVVFLQSALMAWGATLRNFPYRWMLLLALMLAAYVFVDVVSSQTPVQFYISHFTFEPQTGWYRLAIWEYGSASVEQHPLFGIGMRDWSRPSWMASDSIDMFWLVNAMRYGLPGGLLIAFAVMSAFLAVAFRKGLDGMLAVYRLAYLLALTSFCAVGWTVHYWGTAYLFFMFLLGSGVWLLDADVRASATANTASQGGLRQRAFAGAAIGLTSRARAGLKRTDPGVVDA